MGLQIVLHFFSNINRVNCVQKANNRVCRVLLTFLFGSEICFGVNLPIATIFCPVVCITGQLRGEQPDVSEPSGNEKSALGGTQGIPASTSACGTPLELA